ncbi:MAG: hypothetical protein QXO25_04000, partial [Candidatus Bathyarchaeia archaeon]
MDSRPSGAIHRQRQTITTTTTSPTATEATATTPPTALLLRATIPSTIPSTVPSKKAGIDSHRALHYSHCAMARQYWTPEETQYLLTHWHRVSQWTLMKHLRPRTWKSIVAKAARLGLPRGVPQGCESIASAARRTGYCAQTLVNILHKYGVEIRYCYMFYRKNKRLKPRRYVDSFEVDEAIEKHMSTETLHAAAA